MSEQLALKIQTVSVADEDEQPPLYKDREREIRSIRRRRIPWDAALGWTMLRHDVEVIGGDA